MLLITTQNFRWPYSWGALPQTCYCRLIFGHLQIKFVCIHVSVQVVIVALNVNGAFEALKLNLFTVRIDALAHLVKGTANRTTI